MKRKNAWFLLVPGLILASCASMETRYKASMRYPTTKSLEKFIADYPGTGYANKARVKLKELKEADEFRKAEASNSTAAYERFIQSYPEGTLADAARKRIAAPDAEAFLGTCGLGTAMAFQGYAESRPQSKYAALAASRAEYLNAVAKGTLDSHRRFLAKFPNNPFVYEARAAFPILLLEDTKGDTGVLIEVGETVKWRGIFGGSVTKEKVRRKAFEELKKNIEMIGLRPILLSKPDDPAGKGARLVFSVVYKEVKGAYSPPASSPGYSRGQGGYAAQQMHQAAANNLASVIGDIFAPTINHINDISIGDPETREVYYAGIRNLNEKIGKAGLMKALARYKKQGGPSAMVGIADKDGTVRDEAAKLLAKAGDPLAAELLRYFVDDKVPAARAAVAEASNAGGEGKEELILTGNGKKDGMVPLPSGLQHQMIPVNTAPAVEEKTVENANASAPLAVSTGIRDPEEIADYLRMGKKLYEEGDYVRAIGVYKRILNVYAGNKEASDGLLRAEKARTAAELVPGR